MADISRRDIANIINSYLAERLDGRISYAGNLYPADFNDPNYSGSTGVGTPRLSEGNLPAGVVSSSAVVALIRSYVRNWGRVRTVQFLSYYNNKGSLQLRQNVFGVTRLSTSIATVRTQAAASSNGDGGAGWSAGAWIDPWLVGIDNDAASPPAPNLVASINELVNYCNRVYSQITQLDNANGLRITKTFCHSNCHSDCHINRGRR